MRDLPSVGSFGAALRTAVEVVRQRGFRSGNLPVDILEDEDEYLLVFDAPGVEQDDIQLRYLNGRVLVRLDRFRDARDGLDLVVPGRRMSMDGEVELPEDAVVSPEAARATLRSDGTLEVRLPKRRESVEGEGPPGLSE